MHRVVSILARGVGCLAPVWALLLPVGLCRADAQQKGPNQLFHRTMIHDDLLQTDAYSILVPDGWTIKSDISWKQIKTAPYVTVTVTNPGASAEWKQYPQNFYVDGVRENAERAFPFLREKAEQVLAEGNLSALGETIHKMPHSPREYLEQIFIAENCKDMGADARVTKETQMPDLAQTLVQHDPLHRPTTVSTVRYAFNTAQGPMEREFTCGMCVQTFNDGSGKVMIGPDHMYLTRVITRTAPQGKLDALLPLFSTIDSSMSEQLPWFNLRLKLGQEFLRRQQQMLAQMVQQQNDRIAAEEKALQIQRDGINERQRIMHDAAVQESNDLSDRIKANFANQQAAKAECQTSVMHYIQDTNTYRDPKTGTVLDLKTFRYNFIDPEGNVLQTDQPGMDSAPGSHWNTLEKVN